MTRQRSNNSNGRRNSFLFCAAAMLTACPPLTSINAFVPSITPRRSLSTSPLSLLQRNRGSPPYYPPTRTSPPPSSIFKISSTSTRRFGTAVNGDENNDNENKNDNEMTTTTTKFDQALQQGKLRDAIRTLREHPEQVELTRDRWNNIFQAIEERTATAEENTLPTTTRAGSTEFPLESAARQEMTEFYNLLAQQHQLTLFGAATVGGGGGEDDWTTTTSPSSQTTTTAAAAAGSVLVPPAAGSHSVPPALLEEILQMPMKALTPRPTNTLLLAGSAFLLLQWLFSSVVLPILPGMGSGDGIPFNALALSTLLLATLDRLFLNGAVLESILKVLSPQMSQKIVRHEAGHFILAYLLGCPVEGIVLSAWAALQDRRFGSRQVSAGTSFFDPQLSQQINNSSSKNGAKKGGQVTRSSIDRYSIIVMGGIAAEAECYGQADGGAGDELALVAFLSNLGGGGGRGGGTVWNGDAIRNQARWGALQAVLLLREYKPAYDALVDVLERGNSSLGDCIYAIEKAARDNNLKPLQQPLGYIVEDKDNGQVTWTTEVPAAAAAKEQGAVVEGVVAVEEEEETPRRPRRPLDEEESLEVLKEYREQVEEKLRTIDKKLKEIQD